MHVILRLFLCLCAVLTLGTAAAQTAPSSGGGSDRPPADPESASGGVFSDLLEALESGSRLLIEKMQPGEVRDLVDDPRFNGQDSPRATIMTFVEAMALVDRGYDEVGYGRALASLPAGASRAQADTLYGVFLRLGPVSPAALPGEEAIEAAGDTRFVFFPRATEHLWVWQTLETPPDGQITVEKAADGRWTFSRRTLDGLQALSDAMAPLPPRYDESQEGQYFVRVFSPLFEETGLLGWLGFLGTFTVGIGGGILFYRLLRWGAGRVEEGDHSLLARTLRGLGASGGLVVFTILFTVAFGFLALGPVLRPLRFAIPQFLMVIALALLAISLIDVVAAFTKRRIERKGEGHYDRMLVTAIRRILRTLVALVVLLFVLESVLHVNVGALIVGFGVVGLALSLAAQDSVKNLFGAVSIFVNRPFVIGDWIKFKGRLGTHWGTIEDIRLQSTDLRDLGGNIITIPNMLFIDREVENLSARGYIRRELNIAIPYRPDAREAERAMQALMDVFTDDEVLEDANAKGRDGDPHVSFPEFGEAWLTIRGYHWYFMGGEDEDAQRDTERGWFTYLEHCTFVNRKIVDLFGERNIEFAFPTQTVQLIRGNDRA
ncbi:mechanosensitive ion channel family protein [Parvularcula dongshanensis]|uniref:Small-conductance mechanosensitive channel n=1 Tax=Parvularcula dongshanensis TaxID=1173995 RepID=A0A840I2I0_9PROT|nr:mechanosensitive ion channel family protein [Parvularcula dongshanensis]MBB4658398.1 MscS family membrane protein [Parvularcula dongshanensis]